MARYGNMVCEGGKCYKVDAKKEAKAPTPKKQMQPKQKLKHSLDIKGVEDAWRKRYKDY